MVSHGHFKVNGRKVDVPSYSVRVADVITLREQSRNIKFITDNIASGSGIGVPGYLDVDPAKRTIKMSSLPGREDVPLEVDERMVVEFYSK
jgi:small subunit ribosomal protein S4